MRVNSLKSEVVVSNKMKKLAILGLVLAFFAVSCGQKSEVSQMEEVKEAGEVVDKAKEKKLLKILLGKERNFWKNGRS